MRSISFFIGHGMRAIQENCLADAAQSEQHHAVCRASFVAAQNSDLARARSVAQCHLLDVRRRDDNQPPTNARQQ
jgi:hypothetical protein